MLMQGQPASKDRTVMKFTGAITGPNRKALDVCFTPPDITTCDITVGTSLYTGTIDTATSTDLFGATTISDWLYRGFYLQAWPGTKHATFTCIGLTCTNCP
jgi:hypothetical protein